MKGHLKQFALSLTIALALAPGALGANSPSTTANDDSCDISVMPAATLLLPYFEVNYRTPQGETTIITLTNTSNTAQIARVTLWTDRSAPVINFNVYLTGYDTQRLNLFDLIGRGVIAPDNGTGTTISPEGPYSDPNPSLNTTNCEELPGAIPSVYINRMRSAFTTGTIPGFGSIPACPNAGGVHANAVGYATIDLVKSCGFTGPTDPGYFENDIAFDNVLTGDYEQVNNTAGTEASNPLVHIRAIRKESNGKTEFERTFYSRYQNGDTKDARQPLPSTFAARWVDTAEKQTSYKIWREGSFFATSFTCGNYLANANIPVREIVVFDEEENVEGATTSATLPETSLVSIDDPTVFPRSGGSQYGWTYFNLDNGQDGVATQNWVVISNRGANRASDNDATSLGNGCTPETGSSEVSGGPVVIGPAGN